MDRLLFGLRVALLLLLGFGFLVGPRTIQKVEAIQPDSGRAWRISLEHRWFGLLEPLPSFSSRSLCRVYEDGKPLGPQTVADSEIREKGGGRYSHWGRTVWFSTPDNTDPATNGREYRVTYPLRLHPLILVGLILAFLVLHWQKQRTGLGGGPEKWFRDKAPGLAGALRPWWNAGYPVLFVLIFAAGLAYRIYWTLFLEFPGWLPDSSIYLEAALDNHLLPLSLEQMAGTPMIVSLGLNLLGHPVWFLALQNLLWASSTLLLTLALGSKLRLRPLALIMLFYLCFLEKNFLFETALLSEHPARCLNLIFISLLLLRWGDSSLKNALLMGLAAAAAILAKPSGAALAVAYGVSLLAPLWFGKREEFKKRTASVLLFTSIVAAFLGGYGLLFKDRFGIFGLTSAAGYKLMYHTGHLIDLESEKHGEIKTALKEFMPLYLDKYAAKNHHFGNWLNRGSFNPQLREDFGDQSPFKVVQEYASRKYPPEKVRLEINRIYKELALEGIKNNPWGYLKHVRYSIKLALNMGLCGQYDAPPYLGRDEKALAVQARSATQIRSRYPNYGREPPPRLDLLGPPGGGGVALLGRAADLLMAPQAWLTRRVERLRGGIRWVLILSLLTLPLQLFWVRNRTRLLFPTLVMAALAGSVTAYLIFMGLLIVTDPIRTMTNIQDLIMVWFLLQVYLIWGMIRPKGLPSSP
jgi:hypothetical protein